MATPTAPDPSKLVHRLQMLKKRLSNMAKTLETNVASASPVRGIQSEDIVYSTPRLVKELVDGPLGQDRSIFINDLSQVGQEGVMEIRFTLSVSSDKEMEDIIMQLRDNPDVEPKALDLNGA